MRPVIKAAVGSIIAGVLILAFKLLAARVSGSTALLSDALETLVNVGSSGLALYALIVAAKPADREHNYGHGKAELLSAITTGVMILVAAALIFERALSVLRHPHALAPLAGALGIGLALNTIGGVLNGLWAALLFRIGRREHSPALIADAEHLLSDLYTTVGIVAALLAAGLLKLPVLDPVIAIFIAGQIAYMGGKTVLRSISGLLDEAPPPQTTARVRELVRQYAVGAIEAHDLRMRQYGNTSFLEFHLVVPGEMSVNEAHDICDRVEDALEREMEGAVITIHIEPEGKAKHKGVLISGCPDPSADVVGGACGKLLKSAMPKILTGACLCGAVAYEITYVAGDVADICHCAECRRASGAAALPWVQVPHSRFHVTKGAAKAYASSPRATRWFCGDCGTPLYMTDDAGRSVGITLGSLNTPETVHPTVHGWLSEKISWAALEDLPGYAKAPPYDF